MSRPTQSHSPLPLVTLKDLPERYTHLLIDMWGVLHDGHTLYGQTKETLLYLKERGKSLWLFTNAPRLSHALEKLMEQLGVPLSLYNGIHSSGETTLSALTGADHPLKGKLFYYVGQESLHMSLLERLRTQRVHKVDEADYILLAGSCAEEEAVLDQAYKRRLPVVCANPDRKAPEKGGIAACPGETAQMYREKGGEVYFYGKPYETIYIQAMEKMGHPAKERVLAIGDGLATDIAGANRFGIDSLLIKGGLEKNTSPSKLRELMEHYQAFPTYICTHFQ